MQNFLPHLGIGDTMTVQQLLAPSLADAVQVGAEVSVQGTNRSSVPVAGKINPKIVKKKMEPIQVLPHH
jgi:hypothetical protein